MNKKTNISADRLAPRKLTDALTLVKDGFQPVSGGSDLLIRRHSIQKSLSHSLGKKQAEEFKPIFYTGKIEELGSIKLEHGAIRIGSAVTISRIIKSGTCPAVLSEALESIASPGIRNMATLTGNICNASPAGDSLPALYILGAVIETASEDNGDIARRQITIKEFITGPGRTELAPNEIVTAVSFPLPGDCNYIFRKVGTRAANALSKLSVASIWKLDGNIITDLRLSVGACGPTVLRSTEAEALLKGRTTAEVKEWKDEIHNAWSAKLKPIDDQRSTADYRRNTALKIIDNIISNIGG